ncbi:MAG: PAS domain S-box protein [candidate division KSB1 bacterium]|nr:PAS domain S-box protein [candidate division KSB1 bacterium]
MIIDAINISLLVLIGFRLVALLFFFELYVRKRDLKYAVLAFAWFAYLLGPILGLWGYNNTGQINHPVFGLSAAIGTYLLLWAVLLYFYHISKRAVLFWTFSPILILGLAMLYVPELGSKSAVFLQTLFIMLALVIVLFKRKEFVAYAGSSYTWLVIFLVVALTHAFGFLQIYPNAPLSLKFFFTFILNAFLFMFFVRFDHHIALNELKASEARFRSITENSADAIFIVDQKGDYQYVNEKACELFGYSEQEFCGMNITDLNRKTLPDTFKYLVETGSLFTELELRKRDGTSIPVDINAVRLPNGCFYSSCRDITERRKTEDELYQLKNELEEKIRENTIELQEKIADCSSSGMRPFTVNCVWKSCDKKSRH